MANPPRRRDAVYPITRSPFWSWAHNAAARIDAAIAMEARQGRNREDGSDPKDDSAGPKDIAHD